MPRMSWPSWRRTRTVTRAAGMATGAGGARHCWSRGAVSRRREARTGQPGAEQQGRLGARRRASTARDSRGADPRGTAGARVLRAGAPGRRDRSCGCRARSSARRRMRRGRARLSRGVSTWRAGAPVGRHQGATDGARGRQGRVASRHSRARRTGPAGAQQLGRHGRTHGGQAWRGLSGGSVVLRRSGSGLASEPRARCGAGRARRGGWAPGGGRWGVAAWRLSLASRGRAPLGSFAPAVTDGGGDGWGRRSSAGGRPGDRRPLEGRRERRGHGEARSWALANREARGRDRAGRSSDRALGARRRDGGRRDEERLGREERPAAGGLGGGAGELRWLGREAGGGCRGGRSPWRLWLTRPKPNLIPCWNTNPYP